MNYDHIPGLKTIYPELIWSIPNKDQKIFITFDDGPIPQVTFEILDILDHFQSQATFFCIGDNVTKHPDIYSAIIDKGHRTGNHTQHHLNGWKTKPNEYKSNIDQASKHIHSTLFRPPYGKIKKSQIHLIQSEYKIIMWSLLAGDWKPNLNIHKRLEELKRKVKPGAIIVFHDSLKAYTRVMSILPPFLDFCRSEGYQMSIIE